MQDVTIWRSNVWLASLNGVASAVVDDQFLLDRSRWSTQFPELRTMSLAFVNNNFLVLGTEDAGVKVYISGTGSYVPLPFSDEYLNVAELSMCGGDLWVAFENGYGFENGGVGEWGPVPGATPAGFTSVHCTGNAVYFGQTDGGVWRLMNSEWTHIELAGPLDNNLGDIAVDERGRVWTVHTNRGASLFENGEWNEIPSLIAGPGGPMTSVDVAPNGDVWLGAFGGGVWHVDADDPLNPASITNYKKPNSSLMWVQNAVNPNDFEYVVVQDVVVDHQGRVWCGNAFADSGAVIAWNDHGCWGRFDAADGVNSNNPIALYPLDSSVLVGFGSAGIMEINFREPLCTGGQPVAQIPRITQRTTTHGLPSDLVTSLLYDNRDSLWAGTSLGLARYARDRRRFFRIDLPPEAGLSVNALAVDANNSIWVGTSLGLVIREADGSMTFFNSRNSGLVGDHVSGIDIDESTGDVWIATRSGISHTRGPVPTAANLESIVAYPNPFEIGVVDRVRFNAPSGSEIVITTVSGHQVTSIDSDAGWDGRNRGGEMVATGVYLFVVRSPESNFGRGKIAVINRR